VRATFSKRNIRCIADVFCALPIPIIPAAPDGSLELGTTSLRAPHPIHVRYLQPWLFNTITVTL
jgi:light-regulated signal transduction histidine kinase (bacteriophytochrome)